MNILRKIKAKIQGKEIDRIDRILNKLGDLWNENYDFRLGQLLITLTSEYGSKIKGSSGVFYLEDDDLEKIIEKAIQDKKF